MKWLLTLLVVGAIVWWSLWRRQRRDGDMRLLAERGVGVRARVVRKLAHSGKSGRRRILVYQYDVHGRTHRGRARMPERDFDRCPMGGEIDVVHLPDRPEVSAPAASVERHRGGSRSG